MKRNTWNFWIDIVSLVTLVGLAMTGLLLEFVLPPGSRGGQGLSLWGYARHDWGEIHLGFAIAIMALMLVHIWIHWSWVYSTVTALLGRQLVENASMARRAIYGLLFLVALTILFVGGLMWAKSQIQSGGREEAGRHGWRSEGPAKNVSGHITGRMTLAEAAQSAGWPVEQLVKKLNLPADVDVNERLGRLRQRYHFDLEQIRAILSEAPPSEEKSNELGK
jgi:hypothetical protein